MRRAMLILLLTLAPNLFSQNQDEQQYEIVTHRVMMGETVRMLSKKYLVPPSEIYKLNKFAIDGISQGMVLKIPVPVKDKPVPEEVAAEPEAPPAETTPTGTPVATSEPFVTSTAPHRVQSGETLSALAQQYGVTVKAIKEANPKVAKRGLRADEVILIPSVTASDDYANEVTAPRGETDSGSQSIEPIPAADITEAKPGEHRVDEGETLSGLAQRYGVTAKTIRDANPRVAKRGLRSGEVIAIPVTENTVVADAPDAVNPETHSAGQSTGNGAAKGEAIEHTVQPGETLFGLAKKYNVSPDVIKSQNSRILARGLQVGQVIKIKPE